MLSKNLIWFSVLQTNTKFNLFKTRNPHCKIFIIQTINHNVKIGNLCIRQLEALTGEKRSNGNIYMFVSDQVKLYHYFYLIKLMNVGMVQFMDKYIAADIVF